MLMASSPLYVELSRTLNDAEKGRGC
jgi:hypothetical protein